MTETATAAPVVVVGGGIATVSYLTALRAAGYRGDVTVLCEESCRPYDRPPLSKAFQQDGDVDKIALDLGAASDVHWESGARVESIDVGGRSVALHDARTLAYSELVIATGAVPRTLSLLDTATMPVFTLRTLTDATAIRERLIPGARLVVIGGGVIGLELAATARGLGAHVTVVEMQDRLMSRAAPLSLATYLAGLHRQRGVDLRLGRSVVAVHGERLQLDDGSALQADLVVVGIGVAANDRLARDAGIACDDGIFVDGNGRTTAPHVWAIGDVTRQRNPVSGRFERIETWSNAQKQAAVAARALVDADAAPYAEVPWYWSEQHEARVQVAGLPFGEQEVVRRSVDSDRMTILQISAGRLVGVACVDNPREFQACRRWIASRAAVDLPSLADMNIDLARLAASAR